ncbi:hypothetical protein [Sporisorium scitamineum]|nr:hypothetical protein [Sporisorium scitamineum]
MHDANKVDDGDTSTTIGTDGEDERAVNYERIFNGDNNNNFVIPTSDVRSTAVDRDTDDDDFEVSMVKSRPRKAVKTNTAAVEDANPFRSEPATPKKSPRTNAVAGSSKDVNKSPTKKQPSSAPTTPRSGEPASSWTPAHWADLNFAILKIVHDHSLELYDASPNLAPWRVKGRLLPKLRQLLKDAQGGDVASKRWDVELKPTRNKGSPKKQQQPL